MDVKNEMNKWTKYYDHDHDLKLVQVCYYQSVIFLTT